MQRFTETVTAMGQNRRLLMGIPFVGDGWRSLFEDLAMLAEDNLVIGLRSEWVRRVAVPIVMAHRALQSKAAEVERVQKAAASLMQCQDAELRAVCMGWINQRYFERPLAPAEQRTLV